MTDYKYKMKYPPPSCFGAVFYYSNNKPSRTEVGSRKIGYCCDRSDHVAGRIGCLGFWVRKGIECTEITKVFCGCIEEMRG